MRQLQVWGRLSRSSEAVFGRPKRCSSQLTTPFPARKCGGWTTQLRNIMGIMYDNVWYHGQLINLDARFGCEKMSYASQHMTVACGEHDDYLMDRTGYPVAKQSQIPMVNGWATPMVERWWFSIYSPQKASRFSPTWVFSWIVVSGAENSGWWSKWWQIVVLKIVDDDQNSG